MCFGKLSDNSTLDLPEIFSDVREVLDSLEFIFVTQGIVLPVMVVVGIVLNVMCLVVLWNKSLRSAPYYLLRSLTLCDLCILLFALYSDVEPAIRSKVEISAMSGPLIPDCETLRQNLQARLLLGANLTRIDLPFSWSQDSNSTPSETGFEPASEAEVNEQLLLALLLDLLAQSPQGQTNTTGGVVINRPEISPSPQSSQEQTNRTDNVANKRPKISPSHQSSHRQTNTTESVDMNMPKISSSHRQTHRTDNVADNRIKISSSPQSSHGQTNKTDNNMSNNMPKISSSPLRESVPGLTTPSSSRHTVSQLADSPDNVDDIVNDPATRDENINILLPPGHSLTLPITPGHSLTPPITPDHSLTPPITPGHSLTPLITPASDVTSASPVVNSRPLGQAAERWFAYSLMTFNLGVTLTLTLERWVALRFPFRARTLLTPRRTCVAIGLLVALTLGLHVPQLVKEVSLVITSPEKLKDDFQGHMLQSFRREYERAVVYLTSAVLVLTLATNLDLVRALARYKVKVRERRQPGSRVSDVNITVAIIALVFLQTPHSAAMNVLATLSLEGFHGNVASFTRALVTVRLLYVTNSALNCLTYCLLSRRFRGHFASTYRPLCTLRHRLRALRHQ
ncbi:uncharacterized protein LOC118478713 [Aplysia californica]|uniref:Uncharacterized protein LOC118478713 n=1 Tax=Aplysia californica TaxID=6500 RepID=A0ABM1W229_APLCA|nr:uncharacterized protein LOC118478713 [Aplysia californica]